MHDFRLRHRLLFRTAVVCLLAAVPVTLLGGGRAFLLPLSGLGRQQIIDGDLRPFEVGGGLAEQLRVWDWLCRPWIPISAGLVVCLVVIVAAFIRRGEPDVVSRGLAWTWFGASVAIAMGASVLWALDERNIEHDTYAIASLQGVERITRLEFPDGTRLVEARGSEAMNAGVRAVLLMPRSAAKGFLSQERFVSGVSAAQRPTFRGWHFRRSPASWCPGAATPFLAATDARPPHGESYFAAAVADLSDPATAAVYLQWTRPF